MPKYLACVRYNSEGVKGLLKDKASGRRAAVAKELEFLGGKLEAFYYAFGTEDSVTIVELPDNIAAAAFSLAVNAGGRAQLTVTPLLTVEEMDAATTRKAEYIPPGG